MPNRVNKFGFEYFGKLDKMDTSVERVNYIFHEATALFQSNFHIKTIQTRTHSLFDDS